MTKTTNNTTKATGKSQHDLIVHYLGLRIVTGKIPVNEKLPTDIDLNEKFGISRTVFREAIRVLNSKGLTCSIPRVGTVVRPRNNWHLLDPDILEWLSQETPSKEFFNTFLIIRRMLEPELASLAALNASDENILDIETAYNKMKLAKTNIEFIKPDLEFHFAIAQAANNELLLYMFKVFHSLLKQSLAVTSLRPNLHDLSLPRHYAILAAIKNKDPISAKQASLIQLDDTRVAYELIINS